MSVSKTFSRLLIFAIATVIAMSSLVTAQAAGGYQFTSNAGVTFSDVRLNTWADGDGGYTVQITIVPTYQEIQALQSIGSHVDIEVSFLGLSWTGERNVDFSKSTSHYVRDIGGGEITSETMNPTVRVLGLNLGRWVPGEPVTISASIYGYERNSEAFPRVAVDVIPSTWWFADGNCNVAHTYNLAGVDHEYCAVWASDSRARLTDQFGDVRFPI